MGTQSGQIMHFLYWLISDVNTSFSCLVGDVNFRINLPRDEIAQRVNEGDYDALFDYDQVMIWCLQLTV